MLCFALLFSAVLCCVLLYCALLCCAVLYFTLFTNGEGNTLKQYIISKGNVSIFLQVLLSPRTPYEEFHRLFKNTPRDQFPINGESVVSLRKFYRNIYQMDNKPVLP